MSECFGQILLPWLKKLEINLSKRQLEQFDALGSSLLSDPLYPSVSKIFDKEEIVLKHFLDSLAPIRFQFPCWKTARIVYDLGTGGGFPLLPLAVAFPEKEFTGVDSRSKSVDFVSRIAKAIDLKNVEVVHSRIEELGRNKAYREKADLVVCRALSSIRTLFEYTIPLAAVNGCLLFYKGPKMEKELEESANAMKKLGVQKSEMQFEILQEPELPFCRGYLLTLKKRPVSSLYPRKNGLPAAKPL